MVAQDCGQACTSEESAIVVKTLCLTILHASMCACLSSTDLCWFECDCYCIHWYILGTITKVNHTVVMVKSCLPASPDSRP